MIRVLIIDDSAVIRRILSGVLEREPDIEVVGTAVDPYAGREKIARYRPDVITLDIEMPRMDGLSFLEVLMKHHPLPVVVISSLAPEHSDTAIRALELGAIEVIAKPGTGYTTPDFGRVVRAVRAAAAARPIAAARPVKPAAGRSPVVSSPRLQTTHKVIAIGASTGGTKAIENVLTAMPPNAPGTVIVQHMPEHFTAALANRLDGLCQIHVREARDGEAVVPGVALIAPGNKHMVLKRSGANYLIRIQDGPAVHYQRPSVDVLFESVAQAAGSNAVGVLLTGMGADGAKGLMQMKESGARTVVQNEETCVVYGMPKEAIRLGAADRIVPISEMTETILSYFE